MGQTSMVQKQYKEPQQERSKRAGKYFKADKLGNPCHKHGVKRVLLLLTINQFIQHLLGSAARDLGIKCQHAKGHRDVGDRNRHSCF